MYLRLIASIAIIALPTFAFAHGSHGSGIMAGLTHPIFGLDHNFAILGTGILAYLLDKKRWFYYVLAFLGAMIIGGMLGIGEEATFLIEKIIAFSVLAIGLLIAFRVKLNFFLALFILGIFGYFHGFAHGAEMAIDNTALKYISGFSIGTVFLASIGMLLAMLMSKINLKQSYIYALGGGAISCIGIFFLIP